MPSGNSTCGGGLIFRGAAFSGRPILVPILKGDRGLMVMFASCDTRAVVFCSLVSSIFLYLCVGVIVSSLISRPRQRMSGFVYFSSNMFPSCCLCSAPNSISICLMS